MANTKTDVYCSVCSAHAAVESERYDGSMPQHGKVGGNAICHGTGLKPKFIVTPKDREMYTAPAP